MTRDYKWNRHGHTDVFDPGKRTRPRGAGTRVAIPLMIALSSLAVIATADSTLDSGDAAPDRSIGRAPTGGRDWSIEIGSDLQETSPAPLVVDGRVFAASTSRIVAVDASTGAQLWSLPPRSVQAAPVVEGNRVYFADLTGRIVALSTEDGTIIWEKNVRSPIGSAPALAGGVLYCVIDDGRLFAFRSDDGRELWNTTVGTGIEASAVVVDDLVMVSSRPNFNVSAFSIRDGARRWSTPIGDLIAAAPVASHGTIYVGAYDRRLYALNATDGSRSWTVDGAGAVQAGPSVAQGRVIVAGTDGVIRAYNESSGKLLWQNRAGEFLASTPAIHGEGVFVTRWNGGIYRVSLDTGKGGKIASTDGRVLSDPAVDDSRVYFVTLNLNTLVIALNGLRLDLHHLVAGPNACWVITLGMLASLVQRESRLPRHGAPVHGSTRSVNGSPGGFDHDSEAVRGREDA